MLSSELVFYKSEYFYRLNDHRAHLNSDEEEEVKEFEIKKGNYESDKSDESAGIVESTIPQTIINVEKRQKVVPNAGFLEDAERFSSEDGNSTISAKSNIIAAKVKSSHAPNIGAVQVNKPKISEKKYTLPKSMITPYFQRVSEMRNRLFKNVYSNK